MVIGDMGSVRPGVPTLTVALRGMATVTVEVRTLAGAEAQRPVRRRRARRADRAAARARHAARRARRRRRRRACGARSGRARRYSDEEFRDAGRGRCPACRSSAPAASASASGRGRRSPSPASTCCRSTRRVNAVVAVRARQAQPARPSRAGRRRGAGGARRAPRGAAAVRDRARRSQAGETGNGLRRDDRRARPTTAARAALATRLGQRRPVTSRPAARSRS